MDGKFVGAQLNLGVRLPDWAGPAKWEGVPIRFDRIRIRQYHDPGDVIGILRDPIDNNLDVAGNPVK